MKGEPFQRIILKGGRVLRPLLLSVVEIVERDHGPLTGDGRKTLGVKMGGRVYSATFTKRTITVSPM